jgi:curved DNA-binding protein
MADNVTEQTKEKAGTRRGADVERTVKVTLQEAYSGTIRPYTAITAAGQERHAEFAIPPGVATGTRVRYTGYGLFGRAGGAPGDLYLLIEVRPCSSFERQGANLYHQYAANLAELALGGEIPIRTPDGRTLALTLPAGTLPGQRFRLAGEGMPHLHQPDERGDLYVIVSAKPLVVGKTTSVPNDSDWQTDEIIGLVIIAVFFVVVGIGAGLLLYWLIFD